MALAASQNNPHEAESAFLSACEAIHRLQPTYVLPAQTPAQVSKSDTAQTMALTPLVIRSGVILQESQRVRDDLLPLGYLCFRLFDGYLYVEPDRVRLA